MDGKVEQDRSRLSEEIAVLARQYMMEPGMRGIQRIDEKIRAATTDSHWDDMGKWHRVRFRLMRLQQQRVIGDRLGFDSSAAY